MAEVVEDEDEEIIKVIQKPASKPLKKPTVDKFTIKKVAQKSVEQPQTTKVSIGKDKEDIEESKSDDIEMMEPTRVPDADDVEVEQIENTQDSNQKSKFSAKQPVKISSIIKRKPNIGGGLANSLKRKKTS